MRNVMFAMVLSASQIRTRTALDLVAKAEVFVVQSGTPREGLGIAQVIMYTIIRLP